MNAFIKIPEIFTKENYEKRKLMYKIAANQTKKSRISGSSTNCATDYFNFHAQRRS